MVCFLPFKKPRLYYLNRVYRKVFIFCEKAIDTASGEDMAQWQGLTGEPGVPGTVLPEHPLTTGCNTSVLSPPTTWGAQGQVEKVLVKPSAPGSDNSTTRFRRDAFSWDASKP